MQGSIQLAKAILHDRPTRRRWMLGVLLFAVAQVAVGTWVVDDWLSSSEWLFIVFWLSVLVTVCFLLLFALYDLLKVMKGE